MRIYLRCLFFVFISLIAVGAQGSQESIPKELQLVAEKAEDVIDIYLKKDWPKAQLIVNEIDRNEIKVEELMLKNHLPLSMVDEYNYFIFQLTILSKARKQPLQAALVANQITDLCNDLQGFYDHTVPPEIARIDYLGREIVLLSRISRDFNLLNKRIVEIGNVWHRLKPDVEKRKGAKIVLQMDQMIADLKKGPSHSRMSMDGNRILDLVDEMEILFK
jgi:hypothetical protein